MNALATFRVRASRALTALLVVAGARLATLPAPSSAAGIPPDYAPMVVEPTVRDGKTEFDLAPAQARARKEKKRLYVYLGANDCPYCKLYEAFLRQNTGELVGEFARDYLVVDLRSSLSVKSAALFFKVGGQSLDYRAFMRKLGDERERMLVYPSVWLFDADLKPLMQMPAGTGTFQTVPEQLEILRLVQ